MCYSVPKDRFLKLLNLYPKCASWITSRALHRRNYFRQIELTYNMRFGVDSRFDFLRAISLNPERRAQFDDIVLRRVNSTNQHVNEEPYDINMVKTLTDEGLTKSTQGYEVKNMVNYKQSQIELLKKSALASLILHSNVDYLNQTKTMISKVATKVISKIDPIQNMNVANIDFSNL